MKIIEKGTGQRGWSKEFRCTGAGNGGGGCGALLLVEQPDLFRTSSSHYDGSHETYTTFECSECHVWTDVDGVPSSVTCGLPHRYPEPRAVGNSGFR